jgi:uncharacterized protein (UPF0335 family)
MSSQADAAKFGELVERVEKLEAEVAELREAREGKDFSEEVLGKPADPQARRDTRAALDAAFGRRQRGVPPEQSPAT